MTKRTHAVIFANFGNTSPESELKMLHTFLEQHALTTAIVVCKTAIVQPWAENTQQLEIVYLLEKCENQVCFLYFWVLQEACLFEKKSGQEFLFNKKTITVNFEAPFYMEMTNFLSSFDAFSPSCFYRMQPLRIPKPWGQEIWYTGVEKRGVCQVLHSDNSKHLPIPWFLYACPSSLLGEQHASKNLVLIKILDPLPDPVKGDLYYELHQEKNEVYVVTHVSGESGYIKMGINPDKLSLYKNDLSSLKRDFFKIIAEYEKIRRQIDELQEEQKNIPAILQLEEEQRRQKMDEFAGYLPLKVGDVVAVPTLTPHALQHGVRVIEFQTPTYERLIISFAQKVLTQPHWDTQQAFAVMRIQPPQRTSLPKIEAPQCQAMEVVCDFPDFYALRVTLAAKENFLLKGRSHYQILFIVNYEVQLKSAIQVEKIRPGECVFIPAGQGVEITADQSVCLLICVPEKIYRK